MLVYNIRKSRYANTLQASGVANRWNKDDEYVIYTGESIALSTLELVAHRSSIIIRSDYKLLFIELAIEESDITVVTINNLPKNWKSIESYPAFQEIGSKWYKERKTLLLQVPSALVPWEHNYLINTSHPAFSSKVSILSTEDYIWDNRLL